MNIKEKYVYKLTNKINNKVYIGQTNNIKRRIQEHKHDVKTKSHIHRAIKKYGWESFSVEVLYYGPEYDEEERKWVQYYDSTNKEKGYNITTGGISSLGEGNPAAKLTQREVDNVIELLKNTNKTCQQISQELNISLKNIYNINSGVCWIQKDMKYPIRQLTNYLTEDIVNSIYDNLINTDLSYLEIANKWNVKSHMISSINNGKSHKKDGYKYPLRDINKEKKETVEVVIKMLKETNLFYKDIAKQLGVSISMVSNINSGRSWKKKDEEYPIRKNTTCNERR